MSLPIVAVVGRPNVGKSTFVNRIALTRDAIVHEQRGVTRDRSYHQADWNGTHFTLVDTGGIEMGDDDSFQTPIRNQAVMATEEADAILFMVDGTTGATSDDMAVAKMLKRAGCPVLLVVNKMDNPSDETAVWEFYSLGLGMPYPVSSVHGHGTGDVLDELVEVLPSPDDGEDEAIDAISIAIIGRPNAGKSSLANQMLGFERSIVSDVAGTTRDAIDALVARPANAPSSAGRAADKAAVAAAAAAADTTPEADVAPEQFYRIIDTAGLRKKSLIDEDVEYYGFVRALRAIDRADVALLVIDSTLGLTDQDQRVASFAHERGCALVVLLNKWDLLETLEEREKVREQVADRLVFVGYAQVLAISAKTGRSVHRIWGAIDSAYRHFSDTIPTSKLNGLLTELRDFGHTISKGRMRLRINYVTQTGTCPPAFTFFANHPQIINENYERYLENRLRDAFDLSGTPIRLRFKKKD
ncbi:MAG: ribosome biogenesis GTPase Der [Coriobacteriales bacterium]|nr:ribosome biogenesis GTPase Der [Coriobacteriales bacterium]